MRKILFQVQLRPRLQKPLKIVQHRQRDNVGGATGQGMETYLYIGFKSSIMNVSKRMNGVGGGEEREGVGGRGVREREK